MTQPRLEIGFFTGFRFGVGLGFDLDLGFGLSVGLGFGFGCGFGVGLVLGVDAFTVARGVGVSAAGLGAAGALPLLPWAVGEGPLPTGASDEGLPPAKADA